MKLNLDKDYLIWGDNLAMMREFIFDKKTPRYREDKKTEKLQFGEETE